MSRVPGYAARSSKRSFCISITVLVLLCAQLVHAAEAERGTRYVSANGEFVYVKLAQGEEARGDRICRRIKLEEKRRNELNEAREIYADWQQLIHEARVESIRRYIKREIERFERSVSSGEQRLNETPAEATTTHCRKVAPAEQMYPQTGLYRTGQPGPPLWRHSGGMSLAVVANDGRHVIALNEVKGYQGGGTLIVFLMNGKPVGWQKRKILLHKPDRWARDSAEPRWWKTYHYDDASAQFRIETIYGDVYNFDATSGDLL